MERASDREGTREIVPGACTPSTGNNLLLYIRVRIKPQIPTPHMHSVIKYYIGVCYQMINFM